MVSLQDASYYKPPQSEKCTRMPYTYMLEDYPEINLNYDILSGSNISTARKPIDSLRSVLVPVNEGVIKRIIRTYFESNFLEALNEARDPKTVAARPWIAAAAELTHQTLEYVGKLKQKIFPQQRELGISSIAKYVETRDWIRSSIRCIAWHPNCFKIAVAGADDIIRVYTNKASVVPVLKSANQKWITAMSWRPYTTAELAVACEKGICLWSIDNNLQITRTSSQENFLKHPNHYPVIAVQWNSDGTLLASTSIGSTDVVIWNVDRMKSTIIKRIGSACSILKWSPDDAFLFSATVSNVFRVWCTEKKWIPERWTIHSGTIRAACWSPCSNYLLFITTEEPLLYQMQFDGEPLFTTDNTVAPKQAVPIADLSNIIVDEHQIGGHPQAIAWDPNGIYVAVTFDDTPFIVIFTICARKFNLKILPTCFITGNDDQENPSFICFQSTHRHNSESVLTIGWSSGRIQYFPFLKM